MQLDAITLPENLFWQDETTHKPWAQSKERAVNGALILDYQALQFGQPVTLTGGWINRADLALLQAMEAAPTVRRLLTLNDGSTLTVQFDLERGGIVAAPLWPDASPNDSTQYALTLNLITVEPD